MERPPPQFPALLFSDPRRGRSPAHQRLERLRLAFFDNAENNVKLCREWKAHRPLKVVNNGRQVPVDVDCVDVRECTRWPDRRENLKSCHTTLFQKLQDPAFEPDSNVRLVAEALDWLTCGTYYDASSGVDPRALVNEFSNHDVLVFDWDKTISQCEGLIAVTSVEHDNMGKLRQPETRFNEDRVKAAWEEHAELIFGQLQTKEWPDAEGAGGEDFFALYSKSPETVLAAMCGGTRRVEALRRAFETSRAGGNGDIYVITFNPARAVVSTLATALFPKILDHQVFAPNQYAPKQFETVFDKEVYLREQTKYHMIKFEVLPQVNAKRWQRERAADAAAAFRRAAAAAPAAAGDNGGYASIHAELEEDHTEEYRRL